MGGTGRAILGVYRARAGVGSLYLEAINEDFGQSSGRFWAVLAVSNKISAPHRRGSRAVFFIVDKRLFYIDNQGVGDNCDRRCRKGRMSDYTPAGPRSEWSGGEKAPSPFNIPPN
jgi:hypothetical protein